MFHSTYKWCIFCNEWMLSTLQEEIKLQIFNETKYLDMVNFYIFSWMYITRRRLYLLSYFKKSKTSSSHSIDFYHFSHDDK